MTLNGTILDVKYYSPESGFHILVIESSDDEIVTATGNFEPVREGECIIAEGNFVEHPKFGRQFKIEQIKKTAPKNRDSLIKYLKSGIIKGVGEKTASAIVDKFGLDSLKIIENDPLRLSTVEGISKKKAATIADEFNKNRESQDAVMFLQSIGLTMLMSMKIFKAYGANTIQSVTTNPYQLIDDIDGIGFKTADKIALDLKIEPSSSFRVKAATLYVLKDSAERNGNVFLFKEELKEAVQNLLKLELDMDLYIDEMLVEQKLKRVKIAQRDAIYHRMTYKAEKGAAVKLISLLNTIIEDVPRTKNEIEQSITHFQETNSIELNDEQRAAVENAYFNNVAVITGGPGTGKTTIIKCLLWLYELDGLEVMLLAPTGRAAKRMNESTGTEASTIHRAIMNFDKDNKIKQLFADVVIVDEVSMVDIFLFNMLLKSLREGTRLIMLGDKDQLPSVGAGNVLSDIMEKLPIVQLKRIYRQDKFSRIITNAHLINSGKMPLLNEKNADFFFMQEGDNNRMAQTVVQLVKSRLPNYLNIEPDRIQTLCPLKNGPSGSINLNVLLAEAINPPKNGRELRVGSTVFHENDKVMQTTNNYSIEWTRESESGKGVFNGDIGTIISIFEHEAQVLFEDGRRATYSENIDELIPAYAITVHKSQGSEFDAVIIPISSAYPESILTRNLLYTAITRAKRLVVLLGEEYNIKKIINNNYVFRRNSGLKQFIDKAQSDYRKLYG